MQIRLGTHALERLNDRDRFISRSDALLACARLGEWARAQSTLTGTFAVRVLRGSIPPGNDPWGHFSNGGDVVAVVRDGLVVTVCRRRASQPFVPAAFDVERVSVAL